MDVAHEICYQNWHTNDLIILITNTFFYERL